MDELWWWLEGEQLMSAFVPYSAQQGVVVARHDANMNNRVIELLRRRRRQPERDRHMMNERKRRERHKDSFSSLHALLPHGTKSDKNSIMQMAATEIQQLRRRRNAHSLLAFKLPHSNNCAIDSLLELLNSLKPLGSHIISIQSHFTHQQLLAHLLIQTKSAGGGDVEKAVRRRVAEVERKLQGDHGKTWIG